MKKTLQPFSYYKYYEYSLQLHFSISDSFKL